MPKSQIRPPRKPVGESMKVTIANQKREIKNLIDRIKFLVSERDEALKQVGRMSDEILSRKRYGEKLCEDIEELRKRLLNAASAAERNKGWQDCAREVFSELLSKS